MEDIDLGFVKAYTEKLGYRKKPGGVPAENKEFVSEKGGKGGSQRRRHAAVWQESEAFAFPAPASVLSDMRVRRRRSARR